jgi:hypothetical protein
MLNREITAMTHPATKPSADAEVARAIDALLTISSPFYWASEITRFWMNFASITALQAGMARMP